MPLIQNALTTLDSIGRRSSFAHVAEELARAPSSLTYAVQGIKAGLDVLLLDCSGHRACFAPVGRALLAGANALARRSGEVGGSWNGGALAEVLDAG